MQIIRGACALPQPRGGVSRFYAELRQSPPVKEASLSEHAPDICRTGVLTPDHTNRTKNTMVYLSAVPDADEDLKPMIKRAVDGFKADYHRYFHQQNEAYQGKHQALDPLPRLFLIRGLGLVALGRTRKAARVAADIGEHTVLAKLLAHALGGYVPIPEKHIFDMEYWRLQQKKIDQTPWPLLQGQIALITGAGGAIGLGVAKQILAAGAVVVLSDIDRPRLDKVRSILADSFDDTRMESAVLDVTDYPAVEKILEDISCRVGGIDIVVPNAGIAHVAKIEALDPAVLDRVLAVNLKGTFNLIKASALLFKRQGTGGNIVVISSKNVFDPGASFGAYSASKAGAHQLAKIAAMELAEYGVRVNMVNPDAVFGDETLSSQLWDLIGPERMKSRGLDADGLKAYYRERSLLKTPVLPEHVGNAVVFFASDQTPTTGASLPVDAGVSSAFPR